MKKTLPKFDSCLYKNVHFDDSGRCITAKDALLGSLQKMKEPCLDGAAMVYHRPFFHSSRPDELQSFIPGCFNDSLAGGRQVEFLLNHDSASVVGSSRRELTLVDGPDMLAFRMKLPRNTHGHVAGRLAVTGKHECVSVGAHIIESTRRVIAGQNVRIVTRASLFEISLCERGAVDHAFCALVDGATVAPPTATTKSPSFENAKSWHRLTVAIRNCTEVAVNAYGEPRNTADDIDLSGLHRALKELSRIFN